MFRILKPEEGYLVETRRDNLIFIRKYKFDNFIGEIPTSFHAPRVGAGAGGLESLKPLRSGSGPERFQAAGSSVFLRQPSSSDEVCGFSGLLIPAPPKALGL
ncbi:hypothetical protein BpHYR1_031113 [Brachionus plicatilis]|uniref:Uncharacterized protein n=1 Tax=Brachionus plicatilis TaxID=10195 RepID=A0A3M7RRR3_BRAPC|nr:hypothetical protein BpHYR1_031113 [Brachionus plicatilis]